MGRCRQSNLTHAWLLYGSAAAAAASASAVALPAAEAATPTQATTPTKQTESTTETDAAAAASWGLTAAADVVAPAPPTPRSLARSAAAAAAAEVRRRPSESSWFGLSRRAVSRSRQRAWSRRWQPALRPHPGQPTEHSPALGVWVSQVAAIPASVATERRGSPPTPMVAAAAQPTARRPKAHKKEKTRP